MFIYALAQPIDIFDGLIPLPRWIAEDPEANTAWALRATLALADAKTQIRRTPRPPDRRTIHRRPDQRETWHALITTLESTLRLRQHTPGAQAGMAEYLYQRSGGMIGSLSQLIRGAAILAIEDGTEKISREHLDLVPVDYAAQTAYAASTTRRRQGNRRAAEAV